MRLLLFTLRKREWHPNFRISFIVQVKSASRPVIHIKRPNRYKHISGVIPDHISWLFRQELPMFLALIDKKALSIRLFSLSPIWFILYASNQCEIPWLSGLFHGLPVKTPDMSGFRSLKNRLLSLHQAFNWMSIWDFPSPGFLRTI